MEWSENGERSFFRVQVGLQRLIQASRQAIESGFQTVGGGHYNGFVTYETNVPFALRFLVDQGLGGGSWVDVSRDNYTVRKDSEKAGTCQIEIDVYFTNVVPSAEQSLIAPLRILNFDIECYNQYGKGFPEAEKNPVIQIAAEVKEVGSADANMAQCVWTLDSCGDISDTNVFAFEDERELLLSFSRFLVHIDADFVTGYNIINFDLPYLLKRAAALDITSFTELGRLRGVHSRVPLGISEDVFI